MQVSGSSGDTTERVRTFLAGTDVRPEFAARALARIEGQAEELDRSYEWASLSALIRDAARQAEDVAGYAAILAARIEYDATDAFSARRATALLTAAIQRAGEADAMFGELRRLVERAV